MTAARVLIVDDQEELASTIALLLTVTGYTPLTASTAAAARAELRANSAPPDCIICDFHLGAGENGLDLIEEIRARYELEIPAVLMTGDRSPEIEIRAASLHRLQLMIKPFEGTELLDVLTELRSTATRTKQTRTISK